MQEPPEQEDAAKQSIGSVPTGFVTHGPKTVPRVDYERIFVLDVRNSLVGEYALDDECPLESEDLARSLPVSGMRHLISFYQGEYAFTPFKVDDLWFVILTRGIPRIEERGSVGTLLAAARLHIPPMIDPALGKRERELREREEELSEREREVARREGRVGVLEDELQVASTRLSERETEICGREARLATLRDYAAQIEQSFAQLREPRTKEALRADGLSPP